MAVRKKLIRQLVQKLLAKHHILSAPVPVDKIAKALGIKIHLGDVDDDLSGFLYRDTKEKKIIIGANRSHHENRQRFTVAHELGHFFLHKGELVHFDSEPGAFMINLRDSESSRGEDNDEREANFFAAELLMPAEFLAKDLEGQHLDLLEENKFIEKLARKYQVSVQALMFRLANLGYGRI